MKSPYAKRRGSKSEGWHSGGAHRERGIGSWTEVRMSVALGFTPMQAQERTLKSYKHWDWHLVYSHDTCMGKDRNNLPNIFWEWQGNQSLQKVIPWDKFLKFRHVPCIHWLVSEYTLSMRYLEAKKVLRVWS